MTKIQSRRNRAGLIGEEFLREDESLQPRVINGLIRAQIIGLS